MVRVSEKFLQQVTSLAKDGATTVDVSSAKFINVATPVNPTDGANKSYVDGKSFTLSLAEVLANGSTTGGYNITFTGPSPKIISSSPLEIQSDVKITGNVTSFNSGQVSFSDNNIFLNQNYTTAVAKSGGLVLNYLPTATQTSIAATGFTAGVAGVSNPTVHTSGSSVFSAADLIMISGSNNDNNNGLFEVLTHSANLLTIKGIGTTATVQDFTQNQFVTDTTVAGTITKITISVLRAGTDGMWEVAKGSSTNTLNFTDLLTSTAGLSPTGPAGGDLISPTSTNNYPNPLVKGFTTAAGTGTSLTAGSINTGELVSRSGTSLVGISPTALTISGNVTGTLGSSVVGAGTFNGTSLSFGNINDGYLACRSGTSLIGKDPLDLLVYGDVTGTLGNTDVVGGTFNGTSLTFGSVSDSTLLSRSGSSIIGTSVSSLAVGGDASGTLGDISINSLHFNGTQFSLGPIGNTQLLQRVGDTITGIATDTFALKTYVDGYINSTLSTILTNGNATGTKDINFNNNSTCINLKDPVNSKDAVNKSYLQSYVDGYFPNTVMKQEVFTATIAQTVFTLSYSPINQQSTEFFVDGVSQAVGIDYTVSGNVVTHIGSIVFDGGEEVVIKYFTNLNLSSINGLPKILAIDNSTDGYNINFESSSRGINCLDPVSAQDIATKHYIDGYIKPIVVGHTFFVDADNAPILSLRTGNINAPFATIQEAIDKAQGLGWTFVDIIIAPCNANYSGYSDTVTINADILSSCVTISSYLSNDNSSTSVSLNGNFTINGTGDNFVLQLISLFVTSNFLTTNTTINFSICCVNSLLLGNIYNFGHIYISLKGSVVSYIEPVIDGYTNIFFDDYSWSACVDNGSVILPTNYSRSFYGTGSDYVTGFFTHSSLTIGSTAIVSIAAPLVRAGEWAVSSLNSPVNDFMFSFHHTDNGNVYFTITNLSRASGVFNESVNVLCVHGREFKSP